MHGKIQLRQSVNDVSSRASSLIITVFSENIHIYVTVGYGKNNHHEITAIHLPEYRCIVSLSLSRVYRQYTYGKASVRDFLFYNCNSIP